MRTNDMWTATNLDREDQILAAAEAIMKKRLWRVGKIGEPHDAAAYLRSHCGHRENEVFGCMFLDTRHGIIACEDLFNGTIDGAEVHSRVVVKRALELNSASVIFFHNHPSADNSPSASDRAVTARLKAALALVEIRVLDHFIVSNSGTQSMASMGWV